MVIPLTSNPPAARGGHPEPGRCPAERRTPPPPKGGCGGPPCSVRFPLDGLGSAGPGGGEHARGRRIPARQGHEPRDRGGLPRGRCPAPRRARRRVQGARSVAPPPDHPADRAVPARRRLPLVALRDVPRGPARLRVPEPRPGRVDLRPDGPAVPRDRAHRDAPAAQRAFPAPVRPARADRDGHRRGARPRYAGRRGTALARRVHGVRDVPRGARREPTPRDPLRGSSRHGQDLPREGDGQAGRGPVPVHLRAGVPVDVVRRDGSQDPQLLQGAAEGGGPGGRRDRLHRGARRDRRRSCGRVELGARGQRARPDDLADGDLRR